MSATPLLLTLHGRVDVCEETPRSVMDCGQYQASIKTHPLKSARATMMTMILVLFPKAEEIDTGNTACVETSRSRVCYCAVLAKTISNGFFFMQNISCFLRLRRWARCQMMVLLPWHRPSLCRPRWPKHYLWVAHDAGLCCP